MPRIATILLAFWAATFPATAQEVVEPTLSPVDGVGADVDAGAVARIAVEAGVRVDLGKRGGDGGDVTAVAVQKINVSKSVLQQGADNVLNHRDQRRRPQGH